MRQPTFVGSSITTRGGDAKAHDHMLPVAPIEPAEPLLGAGQADLETFDLAEPAFRLGFGDSGDQVVADLGKPCPLGGVRPEEQASDASVLMNPWGPEGACAGADGHPAFLEVPEEGVPLLFSRDPVLLAGAADRRRAMNARWASIVSAG
ncbi:hypothetical protein OG863_01295 [Streptomyces decoyicus]|uniref:Uncharacterized protein n=1 Tax=Streptomyces decoyicus TaxID=249567 RepID=A0ABZ1F935_9ACTN|nr:hypothetical protein [Streptomyces decoyicus]WSB66711.1 hypothetical protein OG863_01295 [Streptomyces decoyicus]